METNAQSSSQAVASEEIKKYENLTEASLSLGSTSYKGTVEQTLTKD